MFGIFKDTVNQMYFIGFITEVTLEGRKKKEITVYALNSHSNNSVHFPNHLNIDDSLVAILVQTMRYNDINYVVVKALDIHSKFQVTINNETKHGRLIKCHKFGTLWSMKNCNSTTVTRS
jgi:hypothetical protein